MFAAIYHPVGLAMVTQKWKNTGMRLAVNGVWGNLGVASAALITGYLIDHGGWRMAFIVPGVVSIAVGIAYCDRAVARDFATRTRRDKPAPRGSAAAVGRSQGAAAARLADRVRDHRGLQHHLPGDDLRAAEDFRRAPAGHRGDVTAWLRGRRGLAGSADVATMVGAFAFMVFAIASMAQLVVGSLLDRVGARPVFMGAAAMQLVFFALMPGLREGWALAVALGFMLGAFGQIPINDFMIGKMASGAARARVYGMRYVVSFTALAAALPLIAFVYERWGFDTLFSCCPARRR